MRAKQLINIPNISILGLSLFKSPDWVKNHEYYLSGILYCSNAMISRFFKYTFISLNFGMTWDLYKSVRSPFDSTTTRHDLIMLFSPSMFLAFFVYWFCHHYIIRLKTE